MHTSNLVPNYLVGPGFKFWPTLVTCSSPACTVCMGWVVWTGINLLKCSSFMQYNKLISVHTADRDELLHLVGINVQNLASSCYLWSIKSQ